MLNLFRSLIFCVVFFGFLARAEELANPNCDKIVASGLEWAKSDELPRRLEHPGFSESADSIYYFFHAPGLVLHLEQSNLAAEPLALKHFLLEYDPIEFAPGSYFRKLFGEKVLNLTEADLGDHYARAFPVDNEGAESLELKIPIGGGRLSEVYISRSTGKIFGVGVLPRNSLARLVHRLRMATGEYRAAEQFGRGTWYNSDSQRRPPRFTPAVVTPTLLPDGLYYGFAQGREIELLVTQSRARMRYNTPVGEQVETFSVKDTRVENRAGFLLLPIEGELGPTLLLYPPQAITIGTYADHLANLVNEYGPTVALPAETRN